MFITNDKEYVNLDSIVYIERAHFDPYRGERFGFNVVIEEADMRRERVTFKDIYHDDVNKKLEEILQLIMQHSKYKWVIFKGDKSIYRINGLKAIIDYSENRIKFVTKDGVFDVFGNNMQELEEYKKLLLSEKQFEPEDMDLSEFY